MRASFSDDPLLALKVTRAVLFCAPPKTPAALAQAVLALATDPAQRQRLGQAGCAYALAHLDRDAVLQRFEVDVMKLLSDV